MILGIYIIGWRVDYKAILKYRRRMMNGRIFLELFWLPFSFFFFFGFRIRRRRGRRRERNLRTEPLIVREMGRGGLLYFSFPA